MSSLMQSYVTELLILFSVNIIAVWALDLQFGVTGINNFGFIIFQSVGAYAGAVFTLGPQSANGGFQHFIGGAHLPYPLSVIAAGIVAGIVAVPIGHMGISRLRGDYQAIVMLVLAVMAVNIANAAVNIVNGPAGLSLIPQPLVQYFHSALQYAWVYVALSVVWALLAFFVVRGVTAAPLGRRLRAIRESESAASALGINVAQMKMRVFVIGAMLAGVSGAVYVQYLGSWGPTSWAYTETFVFFTAIVVGGTGNMLGAALGVALVPIAFQELTRFFPNVGYPGMSASLQWVLIGILMLVFMWFRPKGLIPERRRTFTGGHALALQKARVVEGASGGMSSDV